MSAPAAHPPRGRFLPGLLALLIGALAGAACRPAAAADPAPTLTPAPTSTAAPPPSPTPDYPAIRATIAPLTRQEVPLFDPALARRWDAFSAGDDSAYRAGDARAITAWRAGEVVPIGGALLAGIEEAAGAAVGYLVYDQQTGEPVMVGRLDDATGEVIEIATGYRLAVIDPPGEWTTTGPGGEQFYHYGWSYYRRWRRILPDPLIALAEGFRTGGAAHVSRHLAAYQQAARDYDQGDLTLIPWDDSTAAAVANWLPSAAAPPYLTLPDSGTIDVRRERFLQAVAAGQVVVDEASVIDFLTSERADSGYFMSEEVTVQGVIDALLTPYRSGHLYSDMEAAIILAATYGGDGPLVVRVTPRLDYGAQVPRDAREIRIGAGEVADVIIGYSGTLNARWPHEMAHVLDFRDARNRHPMRPRGGESRCEPLKYMLEYMWWVERFPYDAPDWDWMPVGSGLTLARLLEGRYPNSGC